MKKTKHRHRWSRKYGSVRLCLAGPCGGMRHPSGRIIYMRERVQK